MINIVHNCDCNDFMKDIPDKYYELAIVDPPYGIGRVESKNSKKMNNWNIQIPNKEYFKKLYKISKNQIIWGANYYGNNIIHKGRIVHYKDFTPFLKGQLCKSEGDIASHSFNNTIQVFKFRWCGNVQGDKINWKNEGLDARIHPTQKPVALYKWLLKNYAKPGDKIFDSHVGSGSSRIACYELGFDFEGCELDKDYWETQEKRFMEFKKKFHNKFYIPEEENLLFK